MPAHASRTLVGLLPLLLFASACGGGSDTSAPPATPIDFVGTTVPAAEVGTPYSHQFTTAGGTGTRSFALASGSLPGGVTLADAGALAGTPTAPGSFEFAVRVTSGATSATRSFFLSVAASPVVIATASLTNARVGVAYSATLAATGGSGPFTWTVTTGTLPAGLSLSSAGAITGTPTTAGPAAITVQAASGGRTATKAFTFTVDPAPLAITTRLLPAAVQAQSYAQQLTASGGAVTPTWRVASGALPSGLSMSSGGAITGTPSATGTATFTVEATAGSEVVSKALSLIVGGTVCAVGSPPPTPAATTSWQFTKLAGPTGLAGTLAVTVDPEDDNTIYAAGDSGLFVSRDYGATWTRTLANQVTAVDFARASSCIVYAIENGPLGAPPHRIRKSVDRGRTWSVLLDTPDYIRSMHVGRTNPELLLVGTQLDVKSTRKDVFYRSPDAGVTWTTQPIDGGARGLIAWDIDEDVNGVIYAGTEIFDHKEPYRPPFWRSLDGGLTWQDVTGNMLWHVVSIQTHPTLPIVYALQEGLTVNITTNRGDSWRAINQPSPGLSLLIDRNNPTRFFGGSVVFRTITGGLFVSTDGGERFRQVAMVGLPVGILSLSQGSRTLYAPSYGTGIYRATVPTSP